MKKLFLTFAFIVGIVNVCFAQNQFVATLQHGDHFSHFYGVDALFDAYNSSVDGDIITLSSGSFRFNGDFDKGVTLRGAGIDRQERTIITSEMTFLSTEPNRVTIIEGIQFVGTTTFYSSYRQDGTSNGKIIFNHCRFESIYGAHNDNLSTLMSVQFSGCLCGYINFNTAGLRKFNIEVTNSYVEDMSLDGGNHYNFDHCLIIIDNSFIWSAVITNSILFSSNQYYLDSETTATYCLGVSAIEDWDMFEYLYDTNTNKMNFHYSEIFKTFNPSEGYTLGETFELTEKAQQTYIGSDDTQVGMHGGLAAYSLNLQYPIVTKLKANDHTTKEGMLTIDVEVDGK